MKAIVVQNLDLSPWRIDRFGFDAKRNVMKQFADYTTNPVRPRSLAEQARGS